MTEKASQMGQRLSLCVLHDRAKQARDAMRRCDICEIACGVNRLAGELGPCGLSGVTYLYQRHLSLAEEVELLPAYLVYLSGCNLRCRFCIQGPDCFNPHAGQPVAPRELAHEIERVVQGGAKSVVFIGGEPGLHPHAILDVAARFTRPMPLVLKTNLYLTPRTLELLDGVIRLYVVDFKFGNDDCAATLAGCDRYQQILRRNLLWLKSRGQQVLIRHLLMPGHTQCCLVPVAEWVAANLPQAVFHLMTGYVPAWRAEGDTTLGSTCDAREVAAAEALVRGLGLRLEGGYELD